ncbi:hypothetical protein NQZ68_035337 [Dissostichus eleginoides]|nr:hypothetical protein NQZ68_035337 [Dissostichus eleginoides]
MLTDGYTGELQAFLYKHQLMVSGWLWVGPAAQLHAEMKGCWGEGWRDGGMEDGGWRMALGSLAVMILMDWRMAPVGEIQSSELR